MRWRIVLGGLRADHPELAERLIVLWDRAAVEPDGREHEFVVFRGTEDPPKDEYGTPRGARLGDPMAFPYVFSRAMTLASISARQGTALMLHAAGLTVGDRTAVLVGPSGTGKSTAVRTLGQRFGYVSDETVTIEPNLMISPYPKPISLKSPDRQWDKDEHSPDELGLRRCAERPHVGAVVALRRVADPQEPQLTPIGLIDGMLAVLPESSGIQRLERPLHWLARAMVAGGGPYELQYHEIETCGDVVEDLLRGGGDGQDPIDWIGHPCDGPSAIGSRQDGTSVQRAPWTDAVECDDEVLVLMERRPCRLSGVGAVIWLSAQQPTSEESLLASAVARYGPHPDAPEQVRAAVAQLIDAELLVRTAAP